MTADTTTAPESKPARKKPARSRTATGGKVVRLRQRPARYVNVTHGGDGKPYRYSTGQDDGFDRAVYQRCEITDPKTGDVSEAWTRRAPLPYVHARIVRRDGAERRIGTDYLISTAPDAPGVVNAPRVVVTDEDLTTGAWAVKLGANLSSDRNIISAAGTAARDVAYQDAPEREATPRPDAVTESGHLDLLVPECLPTGYLMTPSGVTPDAAQAIMVQVVEIIAQRPNLALTLGASCGAPFVGPLGRQSHWWDMYGDARRGKSTGLRLAAAVWGRFGKGAYVTPAWNATGQGPTRRLGELGILPACWDERGLSDRSPAAWGELIYSTCEGASRLSAEIKGSGSRQTRGWHGVLFSTGNHRLTDGITAGRFAGVPARVVELAAPLTGSKAEAERLDDLLRGCYGWLGPAVLGRYSLSDVRALLVLAERQVGSPDGGVPGTIAEHLHMAVAGAMMADEIIGTGTMLTDAAVSAALAYLAEHGHEPEHDADRMLAALAESLVSRRPAWPSVSEYIELGESAADSFGGRPDPSRTPLAQHGYDRELYGVRSDDDVWLYVMPSAWRIISEDLGVDSSVACAELYRRELLHVSASLRKRGEWVTSPRIGGRKTPVYQVAQAGLIQGDDERPASPPPDDTPPPTPPAPSASSTPCPACSAAGEWCGMGWVADAGERLPCVCGCGTVTFLRSACGAPRIAHGVDRAEKPAETPTAPTVPAPSAQPRKAARKGKAGKRAEVLAEAKAVLDEGGDVEAMMKRLRLPDALEKSHAPMRRGDDGKMHYPYWRPELPGITDLVEIVDGWQWEREYDGPTVRLDKSGAWVAAASSVEVGFGALEHTGEIEFEGRPGYYLVDIYPWAETGMPHPLDLTEWGTHQVGGQIWLPAPTVALLRDLVEEDRWPDVAVANSYTASSGVRLNEWTKHVNELRAYAIRKYGRAEHGGDGDRYEAVKRSYGQTMSMMLGTMKENGVGRRWKFGINRPDWTHMIQAHAAAMLWRRADQCRKAVPDLGPVALRSVDEMFIPAEALEILTTQIPAGRDRPIIKIDPEGIDLRSFKIKADDEQEQES